ncbi:MAG: hypothetical protein KGV57_02860 [Fusobacterium sp.]|nr:hypothetical protein [Fusobacterium sp.]
MEKDTKFLKKVADFRYRNGRAHLFHSVNKIITRFGNIVKTEKIYISKNYLDYLSERIFGDRNKIRGFFTGNNEYVRLSVVEEFLSDFNVDIVAEIKEDFLEIKKLNSEYSKNLRKRLSEILEENSEQTVEDIDLIENYLKNLKRLEKKIRFFIPEEFYQQKNNYFYTSLISYTRYFKRVEPEHQKILDYIKSK